VLDDVERRRFLIKPAREDPAPALVRLLQVDLKERPGQLFLFPRSGRLARAEANDHVLPPGRLAGMKRDVLDDPVALVEDADDRDPLRHRGHAALPRRSRGRLTAGRRGVLLTALPARGERKGGKQRSGGAVHAYSGIQGS
jgi:hypothetical protein